MDHLPLRATIVLAAALAFLVAGLLAADGTEAEPSQLGFTMSIDLDPDVGQARPTNTRDGPVQFAGNVTVVKLPTNLQRVTVTLTAEMNNAWEAIVSPSTMVVTTSDRPQQFYATVIVPPATPVGSGKLTVTGTGTDGFTTQTTTAEATVQVKQYFDLVVYATWEPEKVRPGDWITGELSVWNRGNGRDTVWVQVSDAHKSVWDYEVEEALIISPDQIATAEFTLYTEEDHKPEGTGNLTVTFSVVSRTASSQGLNYSQVATVTFSYLSFKERLAEDWPVYAAVGVAVAVVAVLSYYGLRWWRTKREGKGPRKRLLGRALGRVSSRLGRKA